MSLKEEEEVCQGGWELREQDGEGPFRSGNSVCEAQGAKEHVNSVSSVGRVWSVEDSEGEASKGRWGPDAWPGRGEVSVPVDVPGLAQGAQRLNPVTQQTCK